ncbi:MAG: carboxypeptidase-like regulatory domain-containing protein, partial [Singulisphaera sp.]
MSTLRACCVLMALLGMAWQARAADEKQAADAKPAVEMRTKRIRIVNPQGAPVAGATVVPWAVRSKQGHGSWRVPGDDHSQPPTMTTDAEGRGEFAFPRFLDKDEKFPAEQFSCRVAHPDFAGSTYNDVPVEGDAFKEESTITIHPGARIEITPFAEGQELNLDHVYVQWSGDAPSRAKNPVNERGAMELPHLPAENELLQIVYVPEEGPALYSEPKKLELKDGDHHQLRMELKPGVRVEGWLEGPVERPVKEGRVIGEVIIWDDQVEGNISWRFASTMRLDGSFVFESVPRGDLQVIALCNGAMAADGEAPDFAQDHEKQQGANFFCRPQVFKLRDETTRIMVKMTPTADCQVQVAGPDGL